MRKRNLRRDMINVFKFFRGHIERGSDILYVRAEITATISRVQSEVTGNVS